MGEFRPGLTNKTTAKTPEQPAPSTVEQLLADKIEITEQLLKFSEEELFYFLGKNKNNEKEEGEIEVERAEPSKKDIIDGELASLKTPSDTGAYLLRINAYKKEKGI